MREKTPRARRWLEGLGWGAPLPLMAAALLSGPAEGFGPREVLAWAAAALGAAPAPAAEQAAVIAAVVLDVRLPRILLAFLAGASLTVSGNALQALFRNPLVSPDILGLTAGAAFGAALALTAGVLPLQGSAFAFALAAVGLTYGIARQRGGASTVALILSGVIVSGVFTALLTIVQFLADPFKLQTIVHWTLGNLHNASWAKVGSAALPMGLGWVGLWLMRWRMNVIALGDDETRAVGLNPEKEKLLILVPATLVASASVAVAGIIGMIGLALPHVVRMAAGPDNRRTVPLSLGFGGGFLVLVDTFSRSTAAFELPVGIFTTLLATPVFVYLLKTRFLPGTGRDVA